MGGVRRGLWRTVLDVLLTDRARGERGEARLHQEDEGTRPEEVERVRLLVARLAVDARLEGGSARVVVVEDGLELVAERGLGGGHARVARGHLEAVIEELGGVVGGRHPEQFSHGTIWASS